MKQPGHSRHGAGRDATRPLRFLLFDLDETLYPAQSGMFGEVGELIHRYMQDRVGIPAGEVRQLRRLYYERYGTTLRGLQIHYQVDPEDYLTYVHDVDASSFIRPNPALERALGDLPQKKVIFTNATADHAWNVLRALGISHHFQRIFDIRALRYYCKPDPMAYQIVLIGLPAAGPECLLVDDTLRNLRAGREAGMRTLWVGTEPCPQDGADYCVTDIAQVRDAVRSLMEESQEAR